MSIAKVCALFMVILSSINAANVSDQQLFDKANVYFEEENWLKARDAYASLTQQNPNKGLYWSRLAKAEYNLKNYTDSIQAYEKAVDLGYGLSSTMYELARCHALIGKKELAIHWIKKGILFGFKGYEKMKSDDALKSLLSDPRFEAIYGKPLPPDGDRTLGWKHDLDFLIDNMERLHFNLFDKISLEEWEERIQYIQRTLPNASDLQIIGEFMKLAAMIGDGHTSLYPPFKELQTGYTFHKLPLELFFFKDGLYVKGAHRQYEEMVGKRVLRIGGVPAEDLLRASGKYFGRDNPMGIKWIGPLYLVLNEFLELENALLSGDKATFLLRDENEDREFTVKSLEELSLSVMQRVKMKDWVYMNDECVQPTPLWLKDPDNTFWFEYLEAEKLLYFQLNQIRDKEQISLKAFCKKLSQYLKKTDIEALVIDIRMNNGGNSYLNRAVIDMIIQAPEINRHGHLFAIIGRRTFSAAQNLASDLEYRTNTIFVGEPTGSKLNFIGEDNPIRLPYSGLIVSIADRYHQGGASNSRDNRIWIAPHIAAELSSSDYRNNNDPALEAIRKYLKSN